MFVIFGINDKNTTRNISKLSQLRKTISKYRYKSCYYLYINRSLVLNKRRKGPSFKQIEADYLNTILC